MKIDCIFRLLFPLTLLCMVITVSGDRTLILILRLYYIIKAIFLTLSLQERMCLLNVFLNAVDYQISLLRIPSLVPGLGFAICNGV